MPVRESTPLLIQAKWWVHDRPLMYDSASLLERSAVSMVALASTARVERTFVSMCTVCNKPIKPEQSFVYISEPDVDFDRIPFYDYAHYICVEQCLLKEEHD